MPGYPFESLYTKLLEVVRFRFELALFQKYKTPMSKMDISLLFLEKSILLLSSGGCSGFICTSQWMTTNYGKKLREMLVKGYIKEIVDFGSLSVFQNANTYPAIFILSQSITDFFLFKRIKLKAQLSLKKINDQLPIEIPFSILSGQPWKLDKIDIKSLLELRNIRWGKLEKFGDSYIGNKSGKIDAFVVTTTVAKELNLETGILYPYAHRGAEVDRYITVKPDNLIVYPYREGEDGKPILLAEDELMSLYPNIYSHLFRFKEKLMQRKDSRKFYATGEDWFRHLRPGSFRYIHAPKLAMKGIAKQSSVGILPKSNSFDGARCPCIILDKTEHYHIYYFLGLLNSFLISYILRSECPPKLSGYIEFSASCLKNIPIRELDFNNQTDKTKHDRLVSLVEQMLSLHKQLAEAKTPPQKSMIQNQIKITDRQIDQLVYELYGLTEEEIAIVEGRV